MLTMKQLQHLTVRFGGEDYTVSLGTYQGKNRKAPKRVAIQLYDKVDGFPGPKATVNLPERELPEGCTFIKDYSENRGMYAALKEAGIVGEIKAIVPSGFIDVIMCELLIAVETYGR